ncbi:MAG TPA: DUF4136 domain-containing protein [Sphingomicrobium sp.]|nr:DUF4136 domain-containing protein [Sphingomicrobium sp.]
MKAIPVLVIAFALSLSGCETMPAAGAGGPAITEAYRVHSGHVTPPARIALGPLDLARADDPVTRAYVGAVAAELSRLGFTPVGDIAQADLLASVDVRTGGPGELAMTGPDMLRSQTMLTGPAPLTALTVQIRRRHDGTPLWQGRATTQLAPARGDVATLSVPLARALFADFPGESGRSIRSR